MTRKDWIRVKDLSVDVSLYSGARWPVKETGKASLQPISITISIPTDVRYSAENDDLDSSINYSTISSGLRSKLGSSAAFSSLEDILRQSLDYLLLQPPFDSLFDEVHLRLVQLKPPVHCRAAVLEASAKRVDSSRWTLISFKHLLEEVDCHAIIGVNASERLEKQLVRMDLSIEDHSQIFEEEKFLDVRAIVRRLYEGVGATEYLTLEALTSYAANEVLQELRPFSSSAPAPIVTIKASKPFALVYASASEVEISRTFLDYPLALETSPSVPETVTTDAPRHTVAIAFGSNLGDSFQHIEGALRMLESTALAGGGELSVVNTSFLYESTPMYVEEQPNFINGACMIETTLSALDLLRLLKNVEEAVGRVPSVRNGPRAIDLDIVFYDSEVIDTRGSAHEADHLDGHLVVPHPRMCEREFVLQPLSDMIPDFEHPLKNCTVTSLLHNVSPDPSLHRVMPVPRHMSPSSKSPPTEAPPTLCHWSFRIPGVERQFPKPKTLLMAIVNTTPDSFSDGSDHLETKVAATCALDAAYDGADIVDVGGYSTRPGAAFVSPEEEINRVVPVISLVRKFLSLSTPISVDTFRPEVAEAAILAGANIINDVYAFIGPQYPYPSLNAEENRVASESMAKLKDIARRYSVPVVLMHSRGDAGSNKAYDGYSYAGPSASVVEGVRVELGYRVEQIIKGKGGIRRWLVFVDPGLGFSKTVEGNLEVLRNASTVTADVVIGPETDRRRNPLVGYPCLVGSSRKSFIGTLLSGDGNTTRSPKDRLFGTAATVACAVRQGAAVIRVHDVHQIDDVLRVSDALWR